MDSSIKTWIVPGSESRRAATESRFRNDGTTVRLPWPSGMTSSSRRMSSRWRYILIATGAGVCLKIWW